MRDGILEEVVVSVKDRNEKQVRLVMLSEKQIRKGWFWNGMRERSVLVRQWVLRVDHTPRSIIRLVTIVFIEWVVVALRVGFNKLFKTCGGYI